MPAASPFSGRVLALVAVLVSLATTMAQISQVHIAQGKTSKTMIFMWASDSTAPGTDVFVSTSPSGASPVHLTGNAGASYNFDYTDTKGVVSPPYTSPLMHWAEATALAPKTTYFYRVGDASKAAFSPWHNFTTLPAPGDGGLPLSFGVLGDLGATVDSISTVNHIMDNPHLAMILHAGDLSYADCGAAKWDSYADLVEPLSVQRPWQVNPGNHEIEYMTGNTGPELFLAYRSRYHMPGDKPDLLGNITWMDPSWSGCCPSSFETTYDYGSSFYSIEAGLAHIIYLNCYTGTRPQSAQYSWLAADLAAVDRLVTPWLFIITHCPQYSSNTAHYQEKQTVEMLGNFEGLYNQYSVNLIVAGHVHAYERSHPVNKGVVTPNAPVYIVIGDAGNAEGHSSSYKQPTPAWSAYRNGTQYGHGEIKIIDARTAEWTWSRNIDGEYVSKDAYTMTNPVASHALS